MKGSFHLNLINNLKTMIMKNKIILLLLTFISISATAQKQWVLDSQYIYYCDTTQSNTPLVKTNILIKQTIQERKMIIKNNKAYRIIHIKGKAGIDNYAWVKSDTGVEIKSLGIVKTYSIFSEVPKCWDLHDNHIFTIRGFVVEFDKLIGLYAIGGGFTQLLERDIEKGYTPFSSPDIPIRHSLTAKYSVSASSNNAKNGRPFPKTLAEIYSEIRQNTFFDMLVDDKQQLYFLGIEQDTLKVWKYDKNRVLKDFEDEWELLHSYKLPLKGYFSAIRKNDVFYIISNEGNIFRLGKKAKKIGTIGKKLSEVILVDDKDSGNLGWLPKNILPNLDKYSIKYILESANKIILK